MTQQQIETLKLALEALKGLYISNFTMPNSPINIAITAIKEALAEHAMREVQRLGQEIEQKIGCVNHDCEQCKAQRTEQEPVQKPVAVVSSCTGVGDKGVRVKWLGGFPQIGDRLYFHPPQRNKD